METMRNESPATYFKRLPRLDPIIPYSLLQEDEKEKAGTDKPGLKDKKKSHKKKIAIRCNTCGVGITDNDYRITINEEHSHTFVNPHGYDYTIGCFSHSVNLVHVDKPSMEWPWFSGYQWQIVVCKGCNIQLGWHFTSDSDDFFGLILAKLSGQS